MVRISEAKLTEAIMGGATLAELADRFGCHPNTISKRKALLGLTRDQIDKPLAQQVAAKKRGRKRSFTDAEFSSAVGSGASVAELADRFGCHPNTISKRKALLGIAKKRSFTDDEFESFVRTGATNKAVGDKFGISKPTVQKHKLRLGLSGQCFREKPSFDDGALRAAHAAGATDAELADLFGVDVRKIRKHRRRLGLDCNRAVAVKMIDWNDANSARLAAAFARTPRPSLEEVAAEFGVSLAAIRTAASRHGFTKKPSCVGTKDTLVRIPCITCGRMFVSENRRYNRMCLRCLNEASGVAA